MHYRSVISIALGVLLLVSCRDDRERTVVRQPVVFTPVISGVGLPTRASNDSWDADDRIGIYMFEHRDNADADVEMYPSLAENVQYKTSASGTSSALVAVDDPIFYPEDGSGVNFMAYYPYQEDIYDSFRVYVEDQSSLAAIDILYHKGTGVAYNNSSSDVGLSFSHLLSKLTINIVPASDDVDVDLSGSVAVALDGFPTQAVVNLRNGSLSEKDMEEIIVDPYKDEELSDENNYSCEAILIPTNGTDYTRSISFVINSEEYSYTIPATVNMESGKAYTYNFKYTGNGIVLAQNTITGWDNIAYGDTQLSVSTNSVELKAVASTGNVIMIMTNSQSEPEWKLSISADEIVEGVGWLTGSLITCIGVKDGFTTYQLTYNVLANTSTIANRMAYYHLVVDGMTIVVSLTQDMLITVSEPLPGSLEFESYYSYKSFTVVTNSPATIAKISYSSSSFGDGTIEQPSWLYVRTTHTINGSTTTWKTDICASENIEIEPSTRYMYVLITIDGVTQRVRVLQKGILEQDITTVSLEEESNSYIVAPGKTIEFPIQRAVEYGGMGVTERNLYIDTMWDEGVIAGCELVTIGVSTYARVKAGNNKGNALIYIYDDNSVRWNYHIWVTDYDPDNGGKVYAYGDGSTYMDRNLGAMGPEFVDPDCSGLFYQWGRPVPFSNNSGWSILTTNDEIGNVSWALRNPDVFLIDPEIYHPWGWLRGSDEGLWGWNSQKTHWDPCPKGWKIPNEKIIISGGSFDTDKNTTTSTPSKYTDGLGNIWSTPGYIDGASGVITQSFACIGMYLNARPPIYDAIVQTWTVANWDGMKRWDWDEINGADVSLPYASGGYVRCVKE